MPTPAADPLQHHTALDERLVDATRGIRLLGSVSWPAAITAVAVVVKIRALFGVTRVPAGMRTAKS